MSDPTNNTTHKNLAETSNKSLSRPAANKGIIEYPHRLEVRLDEKSNLKVKSLKTQKKNVSQLIRNFLNSIEIDTSSPLTQDEIAMLKEVTTYHNNINQIAKRLNILTNTLDLRQPNTNEITQNLEELKAYLQQISAILLSKK